MKGREAVHSYLTPSAKMWILDFLEANGISMTGFLEALAGELHDEMEESEPEDVRRPLVRKARKIDAQHRRRTGRVRGADRAEVTPLHG